MTRFGPLIRLRKWELDEQRRKLRSLEDECAEIENKIAHIREEVRRAGEMSGDEIGVLTLGSFLEAARKHEAELASKRLDKLQEIEDQQAIVQDAFKELKTIEIAQDGHDKAQAAEEARRVQSALDETSLNSFLRRQE